MPSQLPALIFDLDGTLTDSKPGILGCLRKVIDAHQMGDQGDLNRFIGPPVEGWCEELLPNGSEAERTQLARDYRACYDREGWSNNSVFPGIADLLVQLEAAGYPLYVCTSKQQHFAERILTHFGLTKHFRAIYGDKTEYPSHAKPDLLALLLHEQPIDPAHAWMIGDRIHDLEAAEANGVRCLLVGWGYGMAEERARAGKILQSPSNLIPAL
ncbi:HAD family hydrolase [Telmatobacter bradus]|uniref:HAD family hydrolase n=1 Tax=Telmatobacter bradus TaxID=474953 RepID=UPI003B42A3C1